MDPVLDVGVARVFLDGLLTEPRLGGRPTGGGGVVQRVQDGLAFDAEGNLCVVRRRFTRL
jgi:hypothetical protein